MHARARRIPPVLLFVLASLSAAGSPAQNGQPVTLHTAVDPLCDNGTRHFRGFGIQDTDGRVHPLKVERGKVFRVTQIRVKGSVTTPGQPSELKVYGYNSRRMSLFSFNRMLQSDATGVVQADVDFSPPIYVGSGVALCVSSGGGPVEGDYQGTALGFFSADGK